VQEFDSYFATRRYQDLALRPDGDEVAYATDITGRFQVWRQAAEGGWPYQLTAFKSRAARRLAWSPDGKRLVVAADREGDENEQLFLLGRDGGVPRRLTSRSDARYALGDRPWSPDGRLLACTANTDHPANMDLVAIDTETGATRRLSTAPLFHHACCWSRDGELLCAAAVHGRIHQDILVVAPEGGPVRNLTESRPPARRIPIGFSADNGSLYLLTDEDQEFQGLARFDIDNGNLEWIRSPDWDIDLASMSRDARWILYIVNEDSVHTIHLLDRNSGIEPTLPPLSLGKVLALTIAADGSRAALLHDSCRHPAEVVVFDLPRGARRTITDGMIGGVGEEAMVEPEIVRFESFDRKVPGLLYRPRTPRFDPEPDPDSRPALLWIHGGPEVQEQPFYRPLFQFLIAQGFVVLAPNIRGSRGYGKTYQTLIYRDFGGDDLKDLEAAARYLHDLPEVDPKRIAVAGKSYGGFAALSCATRLPDYWAAAIALSAPSDLTTFARNVPRAWQRFMRDWVGDPNEEADELRRRSPLTYVDRLGCPLLVIQGARDARVTREETDRMVESARSAGRSVDYLVFDDEGNFEFLKHENRRRAYRAVADFLLRHLG
jgi:dipeptidyl aminopeptidase/acylaminoacyl peptidase